MESSFIWTCPFKSPTSSTLCFGEPTLGKLNQETDFYMTNHMPKPSSGANRVCVSHSSLVTKNGEDFYGENFIHDFPKSWKHIKEVDWGDKLKLNYTTYGYMLMEIDWGGKFNYTSCGHPMANWQGHETHPTGHKTSEVDWGGHDPNGSDNPPPMSIINLDDLLGRTFLLPMDENGERKRATISEHVKDLCQQQVSREDQLRFKLKIDGDQLDDLISYNQLMEYLEDKTDTGPLEDGLYRFKCIKDHKGPYPLIVQAPYMVHIYKIIFYEKSIKYPFFQHFDIRNGFYRPELVNRQHLGVALGAEVADHRHWNALTSLIFAEWGLLLSLENG